MERDETMMAFDSIIDRLSDLEEHIEAWQKAENQVKIIWNSGSVHKQYFLPLTNGKYMIWLTGLEPFTLRFPEIKSKWTDGFSATSVAWLSRLTEEEWRIPMVNAFQGISVGDRKVIFDRRSDDTALDLRELKNILERISISRVDPNWVVMYKFNPEGHSFWDWYNFHVERQVLRHDKYVSQNLSISDIVCGDENIPQETFKLLRNGLHLGEWGDMNFVRDLFWSASRHLPDEHIPVCRT